MRRDKRGSVPIEFVLGMAFLVLPITLLVVQIPQWLDRVHLAESTALESARLCARASDLGSGQVVATQYASSIPHVLSVTCFAPSGALDPGGAVQGRATVSVPAISVPLLGINTGPFALTRTHAEPVDPYRSFGP
ncbi:MAG: hypothetical protein ACOYN3_02910 [Acidimicrobiia bacterium]